MWWVGLSGALAADRDAKQPEKAATAKPTTAADVQAEFEAFLKAPGRETFLRAQETLTACPAYSPYSSDLEDVSELLQQKEFAKARAKLAAGMPNLLLSPRAHRFAAVAAWESGDAAAAKKEVELVSKCIQGLLATGDGSTARPFVVSRVSDEYDLSRHLGKRVSGQGLRRQDGKSFDVLQCSDKTELWFDITVPFGTISSKLRGK
jgi:hypothetical protein